MMEEQVLDGTVRIGRNIVDHSNNREKENDT